MSATLKVTDQAIGAGGVRHDPYDVEVDGKRVGSVNMNVTFEAMLAPDAYTLQVRDGRKFSRGESFDCADGDVVACRCTGKRFLPLLLASFVVPSLALVLVRQ